MKKTSFLIILFLVCCETNKNILQLPNNVKYQLAHGDQLVAPDKNDLNKYDRQFNNSDNYQIPFFKLIVNDGYKIYFGIPFEKHISEVLEDRSSRTSTLYEKYIVTQNKFKYVLNGNHIIEEYHSVNNSHYITFIETETDSISDLFFKTEFLKSRFSF